MRREEYEERKRQIEEQHQAAVALLESARHQQVRALDLVFFMSSGAEGSPAPSTPEPVSATAEARAPSPAAVGAPSLARPRRRAAWQLVEEIETALPLLPERFDRNDLCLVLGDEPDRGSLYRSLQQLVNEGALEIEFHGSGKSPSRYRKLTPNAQAAPKAHEEG